MYNKIDMTMITCDMHKSLLDPIDPRSYKYLPLWQHKKETKGDPKHTHG